MKLLFVIKSLATTGGGAERVLTDVASELSRRGHEAIVATFDPPGFDSFYSLYERVERVGLALGHPHASASIAETAIRIRALRKLIQTKKPDVVIGFMHSSYVPLSIAMMGLATPLIGSEHVGWEHYAERSAQGLLVRAAAMKTARMTIMSRRIRESFPPAMQRRMTVVPNPVTLTPRATGSQSRRAGHVVLSVGRLDELKNHALLISSFASIAEAFPNWRLRIVGEGPLKAELQAQGDALGLKNRFELPGSIRDIAGEYAAADVFALPSKYESFGLVAAEAMASGLAVIALRDCPGVAELIEDGVTGLLVEAAAYASTLAMVMADAGLRERIGANGPAVSASFSLGPVVDLWEDLLDVAA